MTNQWGSSVSHDMPSREPCFKANEQLWKVFLYLYGKVTKKNPDQEWTEEECVYWIDCVFTEIIDDHKTPLFC